MITLKDLSEYDIKNIDVAKLKETLISRKDILINVAIIVIFFIVMGKILGQKDSIASNLRVEIVDLEKKRSSISEYEDAKEKVKDFFNSLPQGFSKVDNLIDKINEFAILRNIQISSFSPRGKTSTDYYTMTRVDLNMTALRYEDIGFFIHDIENSDYNLRVESWTTSGPSRRRRGRRSYADQADQAEEKMDVALSITSITFNEPK